MFIFLARRILCIERLFYTDERFSLLKFHVSDFTEIYSVFNCLLSEFHVLSVFRVGEFTEIHSVFNWSSFHVL